MPEAWKAFPYLSALHRPEITPSYLVFIDSDGLIKAKNGFTGVIDFSDSDASTVINEALANLTEGRTSPEKVSLKGTFNLTETLLLYDYTVLDLRQAKLILADDANCSMIANVDQTKGNAACSIIGGHLMGNSANQSGAGPFHGIEWIVPGTPDPHTDEFIRNLYLHNVAIEDIKGDCVHIDNDVAGAGTYVFEGVEALWGESDRYGIYLKNVFDSYFHMMHLKGRGAGMYLLWNSNNFFEHIYFAGGFYGAEIEDSKRLAFDTIRLDVLWGHGVYMHGAGSRYCTFVNVQGRDVGYGADNTYDVIHLEGDAAEDAHDNIIANVVYQQENANRARYVVNEESNCDKNIIMVVNGLEAGTAAVRKTGAGTEASHILGGVV